VSDETTMTAEERAIADGRRVRDILDEPVMRTVLERMKQRYLDQWLHGETVEKREQAHARASVLEGFVQECASLIDSGKRESLERDRREQRAAASKPRSR
jgi:hypothetical protein